MGSALWTGISGLNASSKELDVIANNLANTNTVGFKAGTTYFADVLSQSISGGASGTMQVGRGVSVAEVQTQFSNGSFETTGIATDVAIDGDGFFMVNDKDDASYYTRAGAFRLNSDGLLVDTNGYTVQGKEIINGQPTGVLGDIALADVQSEPQVTSTFSIGANLNSDTATGRQYNTSQTVYDSLGSEHSLNTTFTKTAYTGTGNSSSCWGVNWSLDAAAGTSASVDGFIFSNDGTCTGTYTGDLGAITSPAAGTTVSGELDRPGTVYKDAAGLTLTCTEAAGVYSWSLITDADYPNASVLSSSVINSGTGLGTIDISLDGTGTKDLHLTLTGASPANGNTIVVALANNATFSLSDVPVDFSAVTLNNGATIGAANVINWNLQGEGASTITQYASSSVVRSLTSDGYSSGSLKSLSIDSEGIISGFFTNGQTTELAQIMLSKFTNPWGLQKMGDNLFAETITSGAAIQNYAGQGGIGSLTSNSLEMSNTDIATEFIKMITAQKAYQANAKVVTTESDMMQVLMNIKQ